MPDNSIGTADAPAPQEELDFLVAEGLDLLASYRRIEDGALRTSVLQLIYTILEAQERAKHLRRP